MANNLQESALNTPRLLKFKNGATSKLDINIVSGDLIKEDVIIKTKIHETIGDLDVYNFIGRSGVNVTLQLSFDSTSDYDEFDQFVTTGDSFLVLCPFLPDTKPFKLLGNISKSYNYKADAILAEFVLTDALNPEIDESELLNLDLNFGISPSIVNKASLLDKLKTWSNKIYSGVSSGNQGIGKALTGPISTYSAAITNVFQGIASASSLVTSPISSIKNSVSQVQGGLTSVIDSLFTVVNAIKQAPNDLENMINTFLSIGDRLGSLFDTGVQDQNIKYNANLLESTALSIIEIENNFSDLSSLSAENLGTEESLDPNFQANYYLTTIGNRSREAMSILILASILINLYEKAGDVINWSELDIDKLKNTTESIYSYISSKELDANLMAEIMVARNNFFSIYKAIKDQAFKIFEFDANVPMFLTDVVYAVNGNFSFYNETKKLNGVIGGVVYGKVKVLSNEN